VGSRAVGLTSGALVLAICLSACNVGFFGRSSQPGAGDIRYLALGDSYTIGTSVDKSQNFPTAIALRLQQATARHVYIQNLGVNGYTTQDVIQDQLPVAERGGWDVLTVLIGVNDYVHGFTDNHYRDNLRRIYDTMVALKLLAGRVVAMSIPDFSYTPAAANFGTPEIIMANLRNFNSIATEEARARGIPFVDVFDVSRSGIGQADWIAGDGLHPGPRQYQAWTEAIWAVAQPSWSQLH
jgi:lysophospholipase L1-like esterase